MAPPHAFLVARLLVRPSSRWTSPLGESAAEKIDSKPFVALAIHHSDPSYAPGECYGFRLLYVVSPEKPTGPLADRFLPLGGVAGEDGEPLHLNVPLSDSVSPLYLHLRSALLQTPNSYEEGAAIDRGRHQLTDSSYERLCSFIAEHPPPRKPSRDHDYEYESPIDDVFEIGPFSEEVLHSTPTIQDEMVVLERLQRDYSWRGVTAAVSWLRTLRKGVLEIPKNRPPGSSTNPLACVGSPAAHALWLLPIPKDGIPRPESPDNSEEEDDWGDFPPSPKFEPSPEIPLTVAPAQRPRVVALDLFGTVFDRLTSVRTAIGHLRLTDDETHVEALLTRYLEAEALEMKAELRPYPDIVRRALMTLTTTVGARLTEEQTAAACDTVLHPPLLPGAEDMVRELAEAGFTFVGFSTVDTTTLDAHQRALLADLPITILPAPENSAGLVSQCTSHLSAALEYTRTTIVPPPSPEEVVVLSPSSVRVLEPAARLGMTTALFKQRGHPEVGCLRGVYTVTSSLTVASLEGLPELLCEPGSWTRSTVRRRGQLDRRVHGIYQIYADMRRHIFPPPVRIYRARSWLTGDRLVIKTSLPYYSKAAVAYEAAVYRVLAGHPALPRIHWIGEDDGGPKCASVNGSGDVIVMEELGPTLAQIRRLCRGSLSLKSVLMIGLQALNFVEYAHSKGVILRDMKPENMAVGSKPEAAAVIYQFDFDFAKMYVNPTNGEHLPLRTGLTGCGTLQYSSQYQFAGIEQSRRDDMEIMGHTLLYLYHGKLPWERDAYGLSFEAACKFTTEMKAGPEFEPFLARSPVVLADWMRYSRGLAFEEKPDYAYLRGLLQREMDAHGWTEDGLFDWMKPELAERGTLIPEEYKLIRDPDAMPTTKY